MRFNEERTMVHDIRGKLPDGREFHHTVTSEMGEYNTEKPVKVTLRFFGEIGANMPATIADIPAGLIEGLGLAIRQMRAGNSAYVVHEACPIHGYEGKETVGVCSLCDPEAAERDRKMMEQYRASRPAPAATSPAPATTA